MSNAFEFTLNDVPDAAFGVDLPAGNYTMKLMAAPEMTETKEKKVPMLTAKFEVMDGPAKGKEITRYYTLAVTIENGKPTFSRGLIDLKAELKAIGETIPEGFKLTPKNAAKFFGTKFKDKLVNMNCRKYKPKAWKEGEDLGTSYKITDLVKPGQSAGAIALGQLPAGATAPPPEADLEDGSDEEFT